jgi:hypothetical protein
MVSPSLRGLEVDHKLELRRLLNRKITNLGSLQYAVDVRSGVSIKLGGLYRVSHEAVGIGNRQEEGINRGQLVPGREFSHPGAMNNEHKHRVPSGAIGDRRTRPERNTRSELEDDMAAKKKVSRRAKSRAPKSARRMDLTSAKSPRGGALSAPESRVMTIKGATVNIN